jgi:hypothetical protein
MPTPSARPESCGRSALAAAGIFEELLEQPLHFLDR